MVCGTVRHGCILTASGVGYRVDTVAPLVDGDHVELLVEVHGRDGDQRLSGFATAVERDTFAALVKVPGIGPSAALSVLRALAPARLAAAVRDGDTAAICAARGVGRKAADTIVARLDLTGVVDPDDAGPAEPAGGDDELVAALVGLGHDADAATAALARTTGDDGERLGAALAALAAGTHDEETDR